MRYRHEDRARKLIEELTRKEEGIMWAERAAAKIDRDYWKAIRKMNDLKDKMDRAQLKYDAREEGLREGRAEGREEGIEKGMEKGREEVARNALIEGVPIELIKKISGLDEDALKRIQARL